MLGWKRLIAFVATVDLDAAAAFYVDILGLRLEESTPYALVLRAGDVMLRVTLVSDLAPQPFTVLGWQVDDIRATLAELAGKGVPALRYPGLDQDGDGVWTAPGGDLVAWLADPDGNTLSLTQFVSAGRGVPESAA